MGPLLSLNESNYPVVTLFVDLCYPDISSSSIEALWLSSRASEHGIRRSEVRFLVRAQSSSSSQARDKMK